MLWPVVSFAQHNTALRGGACLFSPQPATVTLTCVACCLPPACAFLCVLCCLCAELPHVSARNQRHHQELHGSCCIQGGRALCLKLLWAVMLLLLQLYLTLVRGVLLLTASPACCCCVARCVRYHPPRWLLFQCVCCRHSTRGVSLLSPQPHVCCFLLSTWRVDLRLFVFD